MKIGIKIKNSVKIPANFKKYFWEIDFDKLDFKKNSDYVAVRLLEYGNPYAIKWLFKNISSKKIKEALLKTRNLSPKSANFWAFYFNIDKNKLKCLNKSYLKTQKMCLPR